MIKHKFILPRTIPTDEHSMFVSTKYGEVIIRSVAINFFLIIFFFVHRCEMFLPLLEYRYLSLTLLLLLYHTDYDDCELYDLMIKDKNTKKANGLNLRGFELVGSSLSGWLLLLGRAECRFCCYDLSQK